LNDSEPSYELQVHRRIADVPQEEWDALALGDPSPFVEWEWLHALEISACVGPGTGWMPCHVTLRDAEKTLVAAAPCYVKSNSEGEFVFDYAWAEVAERFGVRYYPKLLVSVPFTPATGARLLTHPDHDRATLVRGMAGALASLSGSLGTSSVHVLFPHEEEAQLLSSAGYLERYGVQFQWQNRGYRTFEDFLSELPSKKRTQLRREMKQPAMDGVVIETLAEGDYTEETVRLMFDLYRSTVEKFHWGRQYLTIDFFERITQTFRHRLAWVVARREGQIIAGAFNVKKGKRLYGRYWGALLDLPFLHFNVCYYHGVQQCIAEGLSAFEPGAGGEHKRVRGFLPTVTRSAHFIENPRMRATIGAFLQREREAVTRFVTEP
jgi:predicted N-acyltransferase